jgi:Reverse transcriptase (RNA-dependent DNA polymerase)
MHPRSELAVVVGHYLNEGGAVMVWLPRSGHVLKRHSVYPVKPTEFLVSIINKASQGETTSDWLGDTVALDIDGPSNTSAGATATETPAVEGSVATQSEDPVVIADDETQDDSLPQSTPEPAAITGAETSQANQPSSSSEPVAAPAAEPPQMPTLTRSERSRVPNPKYAHLSTHIVLTAIQEGNLSIKEALRVDPVAAREAVRAELRQMIDLKVFGRRERRILERALSSKMFLKRKGAGWKARLVIGGHMQNREHMGETYSPTVNTESVNILLGVAHLKGAIRVYVLDVSGAFLHVPLKGTPVHMRLSSEVTEVVLQLAPEFRSDVEKDGTLTVRILKAIYGLGESSRQWYEHLSNTLGTIGYSRLHYDASVCTLRRPDGQLSSVLCSHVDDLLVIDFEPWVKDRLVDCLTKAYGKVRQQDSASLVYVGVNLQRSPAGFTLDQRQLIDGLEYPILGKTSSNAAPSDLVESPIASAPAKSMEQFRSTLMKILYVATKTRFDILFPVTVLASRQASPTERDEQALSQLVQYLKQTRDIGLRIEPRAPILTASADASYACHSDGAGHSGMVCRLGGSTVFAKSGKQKLIAKSSTEAELLALNSATDEVLYLRNLLAELDMPQTKATPISQDNKSAIILAERGELGTKRTKHFNVRHYFVTQHLRDATIDLEYEPGTLIDADGLTKVLVGSYGRDWSERLLSPKAHEHDLVTNPNLNVRGGVLEGTKDCGRILRSYADVVRGPKA